MSTDALKRVALYARVSTNDKGQNPETQLIPLRERAQYNNFVISGEYVDAGISGSKQRRPQLDRMMRDAKLKKFDAVLVWRFDRFGRSTTHLFTALETFKELGIDFMSLTESFDTSTSIGRLMFGMVSLFAQFERDIIRERVQAGVDRAKKQGKQLGRPRCRVDEVKLCEELEKDWNLEAAGRRHGIAPGTVKAIAEKRGLKKPQNVPRKSPARNAL